MTKWTLKDMEAFKPNNLASIQMIAKKLKRQLCIAQTAALNKASQQAGFRDFQHAKQVWGSDDGSTTS
jgi:hypothetical protein